MKKNFQARSYVLNPKEEKVLEAFPSYQGDKTSSITIKELSEVFAKNKRPKKGNSWVRNSLRKLVKLKLVKHVGDGTYQRTKLKPRDVIPEAVREVLKERGAKAA